MALDGVSEVRLDGGNTGCMMSGIFNSESVVASGLPGVGGWGELKVIFSITLRELSEVGSDGR